MTLVKPPDGIHMTMLRRLASKVEADPRLRSYFGWEDAPEDPSDDYKQRRRIFFDDAGAVDPELSPKLCMTLFTAEDDFLQMGDGPNVDSDIAAHIAVVIYVNVEPRSDGEGEKVLVANLHSAVRSVLRSNSVDRTEFGTSLWADAYFIGPSVAFDQSDGLRRAGGVFALFTKARTTGDGDFEEQDWDGTGDSFDAGDP